MGRHVVIGTAGHIDHGKTALVKALTGVDADRWAEEKRRGITIDLGFAKLDLGDGNSASIVDVPGHEDFVRNMVAGATGIDVVLLVVAADEGVMPQTHEHLAILDFLGVQSGVVAITKCDLVDGEWLELVEDDVRQKLARSSIRWRQEPFFVSAHTGQGVDALAVGLRESAEAAGVRSEDDLFRLPVDRAFSIAGAGTVVTGTTWSGTVKTGDEVRLLPSGARGRVRGIEVHEESKDTALPGRRTALALAGVNRDEAGRGTSVVAHDAWRSTSTVDALVNLLPESRSLSQRSRVRFHLGTAEVMARLTPLESEVAPGAKRAAVRFRLEAPIVCRWGDHGVLRSYSPVTTIGGCVIVDPFPEPKPRRPVGLEAKAVADPGGRLAAFVQSTASHGLDVNELTVRLGIPPSVVTPLIESDGAILRAADKLFSPEVVADARDATLRAIEEHHESNPLEPGMPRELARQVLENDSLADRVQSMLEDEGRIAIEGRSIRLASFRPTLSEQQNAARDVLARELKNAGFEGRTASELGDILPQKTVQELIGYLVRQGTTERVGKDRYYDCGELDKLVRVVLNEIDRQGQVTPAELRDITGLSRKYLIPLLEWMDGRSLTFRNGDYRSAGPAAAEY